MKWTITKCYSRGNVGATSLSYDFCKVGTKIGVKTLWDKLREEDDGWEVYKRDGEYVFNNYHINKNGDSWGRSEIVLTYLNYYTIYDYLDDWLKKGKRFEVWWDDDEFGAMVLSNTENGINYILDIKAKEIREIVEYFIGYNFPEELIEIVIQGITAGIDEKLICNNPYASPEYLLDWKVDDEEFKITVLSPLSWGSEYLPCKSKLIITIRR